MADGAPGDSLYWAAVALGKRSVVLDPASAPDRERLLRLAAGADVFIESSDPGEMGALGLDYDFLAARNPALVYVSITPYGQEGPDALRPASELTLEAAGGLLSLQGDPDRPNVPVGFPQAAFHAGAQAAADAALALFERHHSGRGQHLDVSMQAAMVWTLMNATGYPPNVGSNPPGFCETRTTPPQLFPGFRVPPIWPCKDGYFILNVTLPELGGRTLHSLACWAESEGALPPALAGQDWRPWLANVVAGERTPAAVMDVLAAVGAFLAAKSKFEIQQFALTTGSILGPVYTIADLLIDPHLQARDYWVEVAGRLHPGPFARLSRTPLAMSRAAPALGADQLLLEAPPRRPFAPAPAPAPRQQALTGLKVADFAWVGVGPIIAKALADHGATVVHVESEVHPDVLRLLPPFKDGLPGLNRSQFMANFNSSKLGLALDLSTAEGREVARRLIDWADVVVESFTPGTMARWGLDYEAIAADHPGLVMLSTCLRGQSGPERTFTGFGGQGASLAGIHSITGWPDRPPCGPWGAYTDFINPRFGVAALASALLHRARTGEGQHIDLAQSEAGIHFIEPLVLDYTVNGNVATPPGARSPYACPGGVYRCAGQERSIAISAETTPQWHALVATCGLETFASARFDSLSARRAHEDDIHAAIAAWCAPRDAFEAAAELAAAGVPASAVLRPTDLYEDAHLAHRGFFVTLDHAEMGPTPYDGLATRFSATPGRLRKAAPCLGEDTAYVLAEILGLSEAEIAGLAAAGALH